MKFPGYFTSIALAFFTFFFTQNTFAQYSFEPSIDHPYGLPNPVAPKQITDWAPMIGKCDCKSVSRKADGTWNEPENMTWTFKYIMNGFGVQDETLKEGGINSGSIRQFNADSSKWYVHYYSNGGVTPVLSAWAGTRQDTAIILYREQKAPNGTEGFYKIHFYDMTDEGFEWFGEWVNTTETFSYPTWKISCKRRLAENAEREKEKILGLIDDFSKAYINGDAATMANAYTKDGKIFPGNSDIISGAEAIQKFWTLPEGVKTTSHKIRPEQITILGDTAYDYGYYEGSTLRDGQDNPFAGKYVIVWKKENGVWKMALDIWNRR